MVNPCNPFQVKIKVQAPIVQTLDNRINHYPADKYKRRLINNTYDASQRWGLNAWPKRPLSPKDPPEDDVKDR